MDSLGGSGVAPAAFAPDYAATDGERDAQALGVHPPKPLKRADTQRTAQVKRWLDETYPAIAARAKREKAEIHWGDETGLRSDSQHGRRYAPKGKTPVIRRSAKRVSMKMLSTVSNRGKVRFMVYCGRMNAKRLIQFLKPLIRTSGHRIFLILDNLRMHHARLVKTWLADKRNKARIEVFISAGLLTRTESG